MKFLSNSSVFKMDYKIYLVFILVVTIAIANALLSTTKIQNSRDTIFEITESTNPTLEDLGEFNMLVTRSRMYISNWVYLPNNNTDKTNLVQLNSVTYPDLKKRLISRMKGWKSEKHMNQVQKLFRDYEEVIREQEKIMKSLRDFDDYQDPMKKILAEEQLESEIIPSTNKIMVNLKTLITVKKEAASMMSRQMIKDNMHLLMIVFSLAILIVVSVMVAGLYMMKKIIIPLLNVRGVMLKMSQGELPEVVMKSENNALDEMMEALRQLSERLQKTSSFAREIGRSNFDASFDPLSSRDVLGHALIEMRDRLKNAAEADAHRNWSSEGFAMISNILHCSSQDIKTLSDEIICGLTIYVQANEGAVFLVNSDEDDEFIETLSYYSLNSQPNPYGRIEMNEGQIGQVITANQYMISKDEDSVYTFILPLFAGGRVIGALQIKTGNPISTGQVEFIERICEPVASNILNLNANLLTRKLLRESQIKTRELATQEEALKRVNLELENKALLLGEKNIAIEEAHKALALKAEQLEISSKYKSDFLANMSHELRTPLNSVLILARLLAENKSGNMTPRQVEHAKVIHKSGSDLLVIINDILDLSKIEAGKLELNYENISVNEVCSNMQQLFQEVSREKNISFSTIISTGAEKFIYTDRVRLEQVLKNLLSNAFKFTPSGGMVEMLVDLDNSTGERLCFSVKDNGIGIPEEKQELIFEAFNQADSSITRRYGGTGLGLAICNQLSSMLGGKISLESSDGIGSVFRFSIPVESNGSTREKVPASQHVPGILLITTSTKAVSEWSVAFASFNLQVKSISTDEIVNINYTPEFIIIDDTLPDHKFVEYVKLIRSHKPTSGCRIISRSFSEFVPAEIKEDIFIHTTSVINHALIDNITGASNTIPGIKKISERELREVPVQAVMQGQFNKSVSDRLKGMKILVADDDMRNVYSLTTIFENEGANVIFALDGNEALDQVRSNHDIDIILMDIMMPNMDGLKAMQEIRKMKSGTEVPIIAVTAKALQGDREICMKAGASSYITKPVDIELLLSRIMELVQKV